MEFRDETDKALGRVMLQMMAKEGAKVKGPYKWKALWPERIMPLRRSTAHHLAVTMRAINHQKKSGTKI